MLPNRNSNKDSMIREDKMFEKILFPADFSEYAQKTLECIGEIPGIKELMLLHVVDATHPSKRGWTHGPHIENAKILMEAPPQT